jgi:hypothetical protein
LLAQFHAHIGCVYTSHSAQDHARVTEYGKTKRHDGDHEIDVFEGQRQHDHAIHHLLDRLPDVVLMIISAEYGLLLGDSKVGIIHTPVSKHLWGCLIPYSSDESLAR